MSTFGGIMPEFPDIRVDYFRQIRDLRPPLACFLSHVHTDHLAGLETLKSPFVYCSAGTRDLLLRLERQYHRVNFARGILERRKQHYKHLKNLLKPIPLETPTRIELAPGRDLQVTLFDANHCTGAVMFLIENDSNAILYTGDIRSEPWFVNSLARNPCLIEYTCGLKRLDCIYLDTSNTGPITFPSKADGLKELLRKVSKYPADTVFHFTAWTFGYEEVWVALSRALKSQIHVDDYKLKLYQSLRGNTSDKAGSSGSILSPDAPSLVGYQCGNTPQLGCLTNDINVRIHGCEKGMHCKAINDKTVFIRPIVTRTPAGEVGEVGIGGGLGDLTRQPELELDSDYMINEFLGLFGDTEDLIMQDIKRMLLEALRSKKRSLALDDLNINQEGDEYKIENLTKLLAQSASDKRSEKLTDSLKKQGILPRVITFPYSRHSSYEELRHLVTIFNPQDIYPCTVDERNWDEGGSMQHLFGDVCTAKVFRHDQEMREMHRHQDIEDHSQQSQTTVVSRSSQMLPPSSLLERQIETSPQGAALYTIRRNQEGQLRCFDSEGNERPPGEGASTVVSTPPREIVASSPGSESQSLRRKEILEGLGIGKPDIFERQPKRARFDSDGPVYISSSPVSVSERNSGGQPAEPIIISEVASQVSTSESDGRMQEDEEDEENPFAYWDGDDEVYRCRSCGHEMWSLLGNCTNCPTGEEHPYYEVLDPERGARPRFVVDPDDDSEEMDSDTRDEVVGDYPEYQSSAYDSYDELGKERDIEYEVNSFIDDEETQPSEEDSDGSSSDGETVYKDKLTELQKRHDSLQQNYRNMATAYHHLDEEFDSFRRDVMGSEYDSDEGMEDYDDDGILMIDVNAPVVAEVTEVLIEHANGESQESEISPERMRDRVEAYTAAMDRSWHNISLVSAENNHTIAEVEL